MTVKEAIDLLENAIDDDSPSAVNPSLTTSQALTIIIKGLPLDYEEVLSDLYEKRIYQVVRNQKKPRY